MSFVSSQLWAFIRFSSSSEASETVNNANVPSAWRTRWLCSWHLRSQTGRPHVISPWSAYPLDWLLQLGVVGRRSGRMRHNSSISSGRWSQCYRQRLSSECRETVGAHFTSACTPKKYKNGIVSLEIFVLSKHKLRMLWTCWLHRQNIARASRNLGESNCHQTSTSLKKTCRVSPVFSGDSHSPMNTSVTSSQSLTYRKR